MEPNFLKQFARVIESVTNGICNYSNRAVGDSVMLGKGLYLWPQSVKSMQLLETCSTKVLTLTDTSGK